jgi:MerR family transcriptional regulator, light-induced transcriptional regulator
MGKYSIKELEKLSGIKAHTIRIWEKRHRLIDPQRTNTNIRFYSDEDLKKIMNVSLLNSTGIKISRIAEMSLDEMNKKVLELSETKTEALIYIDQLVVAMVDLDEEKFEKILSNIVLKFTFERAIVEIVYPFLEKIGVLWQTQNISPAQEHFISNLIRQKLIVAIDSLPIAPQHAKRALLFLPENEMHELGLLFYHYIIRKAGHRTYYLGQVVPHRDLVSVYHVHKPDVLVTAIITATTGQTIQNYIKLLATDFPSAKIFIAGAQIQKLTSTPFSNVILISEVSQIIRKFLG